MSIQVTYIGRTVAPAVRFFAPLPLLRHLRPGYGLNALPDLGLGHLNGAYPGRIKRATHVANLVDSALKGRDPAANECRQQVVGGQPFSSELLHNLVDVVDLYHLVGRVVPPIELRSGGADDEVRQIDQIDGGRILHIKEGALPFPA